MTVDIHKKSWECLTNGRLRENGATLKFRRYYRIFTVTYVFHCMFTLAPFNQQMTKRMYNVAQIHFFKPVTHAEFASKTSRKKIPTLSFIWMPMG